MKRSWLWYAILTLIVWGTMPEIRRLIDFKLGLFQPIEIASVVPLAMLAPFVWYAVRGGWRGAAPLTRTFATIWLAAYGYAFAIGMLTGAPPIAVAYEFVNTCAPVAIGIWFANEVAAHDASARAIVTTLLALGTFSSIFAVAQHIAPFPWDAMWIYASGFSAAGLPYPFSMRAWGTMNSPGPFADYLVCTILLSLTFVDFKRPLALAGIVICCLGLAVTFVRADAIVLAAAVVAYLAISPRRVPVMTGIFGMLLLVGIGLTVGPSLFGDTGTRIVERITDRFSTLDQLDTDVSVVERQNEIENGIQSGFANPVGLGLGVVGPAAKFENGSTQNASIDSGYVSRFDALGYLGFLGYITVTFGALALTVRQAFRLAGRGEHERAGVVAAAAVAQAALVAIDFAVDSHSAFDGILFWLSLAMGFGYGATTDVREENAIDNRGPSSFGEVSPAS